MKHPNLINITSNSNNDIEEDIEKKEYHINDIDNNPITILIIKTNDNIIIRSLFYEIKLTSKELSLITKIKFDSLNEVFEFINNIFEQNKYKIKDISSNCMKLNINTYDNIKGKEKEIELKLTENFGNKDILIKDLFNKFMKMEREIK